MLSVAGAPTWRNEEAIERRLIADHLAREELGPVVAVYAARNAVVFDGYLLSASACDEGVAQSNRDGRIGVAVDREQRGFAMLELVGGVGGRPFG